MISWFEWQGHKENHLLSMVSTAENQNHSNGIHHGTHKDDGYHYCDFDFLQWKPMIRGDSLCDPATQTRKSFKTPRYFQIRTTFVICNLFGTILRYLPWNVCIKMYLRIGEAKNPGPTSQPQRKPQPNQPDANGRKVQTVQFATANVVSMVDKAPWFNSFDHE